MPKIFSKLKLSPRTNAAQITTTIKLILMIGKTKLAESSFKHFNLATVVNENKIPLANERSNRISKFLILKPSIKIMEDEIKATVRRNEIVTKEGSDFLTEATLYRKS